MKQTVVETIKIVIGLSLLVADATVSIVRKLRNLKRKKNVK